MGAVLLAVLLLGGIGSSLWVSRHSDDLAGKMEDAAWQAMAENWDQARQTASEVSGRWQRGWYLCGAFGDHAPMEQIDAQLAQLSVYAAARDPVAFAAACTGLARQLRAMGDAHRLSWWNLL